MTTRPTLSDVGLSTGKKARLHRILYRHGLGNGTAIFLPYDQGLEHGPRDFFANPVAADPRYSIRLALDGGFNGIAVQIGLAEKFYWDFAGEVPLILKLNGKPTRTRAEFRSAIEGVQAGDIVTLEVLRRTPDGWDTAIVRIRAR